MEENSASNSCCQKLFTTEKCKFCSTTFRSKSEYLNHIEIKHGPNLKSDYMCSYCGKQYRTKSELTVHIKSKCGTIKLFKCKVCEKDFMSAGSLHNHMIRHSGVQKFMCRFCAKLFYTAGQLKTHERIHTQDKPFVCDTCGKGFCHRQSLITHCTIHTGIKPYQCENCYRSFSCVGNLIKHRKTHKNTCGAVPLKTHSVQHIPTMYKVRVNTPASSRLKRKEMDIQLKEEIVALKHEVEQLNGTICPKQGGISEKSSNPSNASSHQHNDVDDGGLSVEDCKPEIKAKTHSKSKKTRAKGVVEESKEDLEAFVAQTDFRTKGFGVCQFCQKKYTVLRWFYSHVKSHENQNETQNRCSCCKMSFPTKQECSLHQQSTHADVLTCQECDRIFSNKDSLRCHQKISHRGFQRKSYTYICDKCGKQFKQKSDLITHNERNCIKGPAYECPVCKKVFSSKHTRNNHMRLHGSDKKYPCRFCLKSFHWKGQLKIHERSHTGEKPFACLYCPKSFAYRESLITHSTVHTGIKPHLCEGCGSRFSCIGNLIKHKTNHATQCGAWTYKSQEAPKMDCNDSINLRLIHL